MSIEKTVIDSKNLEDYLYSIWPNPKTLSGDKSIILYADAALQLKLEGENHVVGIKNKGLPYARIFELMGWAYSELYYSHHNATMEEPIMEKADITRLRCKKVVLADDELDTGSTLKMTINFLNYEGVRVRGIFIDDVMNWEWETAKRTGMRKLPYFFFNRNCGEGERKVEVFTSTTQEKINEATERVFQYLHEMRKL